MAFDDDCRQAKRLLRSTERVARHAGPLSDLASPTVQAWRNQRRQYFNLLRQKKSCFWTARVTTDQSNPRQLRQSLDQLLGHGRTPPTDISASVLHKAFDDKITAVFSATAGASEPAFTAAPAGCELRVFRPVTQADVTRMIRALPDKQCSSDPLPTWLLKTNVDLLAPFLCHLFCHSLEHSVVPSRMKAALYYADCEKGRHGPDRDQVLSTDF